LGNILSPLLFNFYSHLLNKFVEKIIENIPRTDRRKIKFWIKKKLKSNSSNIKKLLIKVK